VVLETKGLSKSYGSLRAVNNLSIKVHEGEILGFLGPNGAGKTTSIRMICGLLKPDAGQVLIRGKIVDGGDEELRVKIGMCPQETIIWEKLTVKEQMEYVGEIYDLPLKKVRLRSAELLDVLGLTEKANSLGGTLSGGMRRRLNIALALIHDPEILILDEPEAGLDPQSRVLVREYVRSLARQKTIILTTHNMDEAERMADRVAIIDHGNLLVMDTPSALKQAVGQVDMLKIQVGGKMLALAIDCLQDYKHTDDPEQDEIIIHYGGVIAEIPKILHRLEEARVEVVNLQLRTNTLEDVFLSLTGRRLRE